MSRRSPLLLAFCLVGGLLAGCSGTDSTQSDAGRAADTGAAPATTDEAPPPEDAGPAPTAVSALIDTALQSGGALDARDFERRLGPPQQIEIRPVPNQYVEDQTDTLRTLIYRGLRAQVYGVTGRPKALLVRLVLRSAQYETPEGLRIGLSEQAVLETVGEPTRRNATQNELVYQEDGPTPTSMVVRLQDGAVARIMWEFPFT